MTRLRCLPVLCLLLPVWALPTAAVRANTFSALAFENSTVWPSGPRPAPSGVNFFDVEGINNNSFAAYGVADFNLGDLVDACGNAISGTPSAVNAITITLIQDNAAFTTNGAINFYLAEDTTTSILPADQAVFFDSANDPEGLNGQLAPVHLLGSAMFTQSCNGTVDSFSFTPDCATTTYIQSVLSSTCGGSFRVIITPADPSVSATYAGFKNVGFPGGPTLTLDLSF